MQTDFEALANDEAMAKFIEENTGEDGVLNPEAAERLLSGDYGDTGEGTPESGDTPASTQTEDPSAAADAGAKEGAEDPPQEPQETGKPKEDEQQEPVVKAKDGVHEIPYKVVEDLRSDNKALREQLDSVNERLEKLVGQDKAEEIAEAQRKDEETGTTEATEELFEEIEAEFPGTGKLLKTLSATVEALQAEKQQAEQAKKEADEQAVAQAEFEEELAKLAPNYKEVEANQKFWDFVDGQSPRVKRSMEEDLSSGDPQKVAGVIKEWEETLATGSDKPEEPSKKDAKKPKVDQAEAKRKAEEAAKAAEEKPNARSLTDIPGGTNPSHDEAEAIMNMDGQQLLAKMEGWSPEKIEQHLNRVL